MVLITFILAFLAGLFISLPSAFAAVDVYTYGGGDLLYIVLNAVAMLSKSTTMKSLLQLTAVLAFAGVILRFAGSLLDAKPDSGEGGFAILTRIAILSAVALVFISVREDVQIIDIAKPSNTRLVADVPKIQAQFISWASTIGEVVGGKMEEMFSMPDSIAFSNQGVAMGAKYSGSFMSIYPPNDATMQGSSGVYRNGLVYTALREWYSKCLFDNFGSVNNDQQTAAAFLGMGSSSDILHDANILATANDPYTLITGVKAGEPFMECSVAMPNILAAWNEVYPAWIKSAVRQVRGEIGASQSTDNDAQFQMQAEEIITHYLPGAGDPATIFMQVAALNTMNDALQIYTAGTGAGSAMASQLARRTYGAEGAGMAKMLNAAVLLLRQMAEMFVYGLGVFLPMALLLIGVDAVIGYFKAVLWLNLWVPFYVLLNLFVDSRLADSINNLTTVAGGGLTYNNFRSVQEQANMIIALVGMTAWTVPSLAWAVISGGTKALSGIASAGGGAQGTAGRVSGQVEGQGNVNVQTRSAGNANVGTSTSGTSTVSGRHAAVNNAAFVRTLLGTSGAAEMSRGLSNAGIRSLNTGLAFQSDAAAKRTGNVEGQRADGTAASFDDIAGKYNLTSKELQSSFELMNSGTGAATLDKVSASSPDKKDEIPSGNRFNLAANRMTDVNSDKMVMSFNQISEGIDYIKTHFPENSSDYLKAFGGAGVAEAAAKLGNSQAFDAAYTEAVGGKLSPDDKQRYVDAKAALQVPEQKQAAQKTMQDLEKTAGLTRADFFKTGYEARLGRDYIAGKVDNENAANLHYANGKFDKNATGGKQDLYTARATESVSKDIGRLNAIIGTLGVQSKGVKSKGETFEDFNRRLGELDALTSAGRKDAADAMMDDAEWRNSEAGQIANVGAKMNVLRQVAALTDRNDKNAYIPGENDKAQEIQEKNRSFYNFLKAHQGASVSAALTDSQAQHFGLSHGGRASLTFGLDGKLSNVELTSGTSQTHRNVNDSDIGSQAYERALDGDLSLGGFMTDSRNGSYERREATLAAALSKSSDEFFARQGKNSDSSFASGRMRVSAATPLGGIIGTSAGVDGSAGVDVRSSDDKSANLKTVDWAQTIRTAYSESQDLPQGEKQAYISRRIGDAARSQYGDVFQQSPANFGASKPGSAITTAAEKALERVDEMKEDFMNRLGEGGLENVLPKRVESPEGKRSWDDLGIKRIDTSSDKE